MEEQKGGGGEDDVICQRDYKERWQNMTANWVRACVCVCAVTSPREFRAKQHQRRCSVTELERQIKNSPERWCRRQVNTPPLFDSVENNSEEVDQEGRRLVLYIEPEPLKLSLTTGQTKFGSIFITFKRN